jgi:DNA-3-methyladenine glycosylase
MMLTAEFFARPTLQVAPELLGATLFVETDEGQCSGRIVEVEAYLGSEDAASHAAGGVTPRSSVMFGAPGRTYVYLIYGMHHCLNFVTESEGTPGAILIRGLEPLTGLDLMMARRGVSVEKDLCNGPGKLCRALAIDRTWNDLPLTGQSPQKIYLNSSEKVFKYIQSPRIGIREAMDLPYRFSTS